MGFTRHIVTDETTIEMAVAAATRALKSARLSANQLGCIVTCGAVPYQAVPSTAVLVQQRLGLDSSAIPAFDVNATCLGFFWPCWMSRQQ